MFATWGRLVYRYRWATLALSVLLFLASFVILGQGGTLGTGNLNTAESIRALDLMSSQLPKTSGSASFEIIFGSSAYSVADPRFRVAVLAALAPLRSDRRVAGFTTPYDSAPAMAALRSRDGHHALVTVNLRDVFGVARDYYTQVRSRIRSSTLDVVATGELAITSGFDTTLKSDLRRAELVALPLALVLLLLVFTTVVAALLPLGVGMITILGGLAGVYVLTRITDVSQYALNIVTLIGLGVAIDYSLFIVSRFREELARGSSVDEALSRAMGTAGRAIAFSGLTVAIGLGGLVFYQGTFLASMGVAGAIVVAVALVYALTFLPAMLALLGPRVNRWRLPLFRQSSGRGMWHRLAMAVMRRPILVLAVALPVVLVLGSPFLHLRLASGDVRQLPPSAESHRGYDLLNANFPDQTQTTIITVVQFPGSPLTAARVGALYDLSRKVARLANVQKVQSPLDISPTLSQADYMRMYTGPRDVLPASVRTELRQDIGGHIAVLNVQTVQASESDQARSIVRAIRRIRMAGDGHILVTGTTAYDIDAIDTIFSDTPAAMTFIMLMTYLVLFLLLGSVVLPLKAVITDVLSITASFGALVWIFQDGHLSGQLNFTPASLDPSVPILLFCIVFGLSMDYEVMLLSRIKEAYDHHGDNRASVAEGLERSGRLITGAAAIMIVVFAAFALANVTLIKAIGLGMAIAVAVDATIVRALIVPALMRLMGDLNWWSPAPLARLYRRLGLAEEAPAAEEVVPVPVEVAG